MKDELPHAGKKRHDKGDEGTGHSMRVGVMGFHLGKKRRDVDDKTTRPTTADTLVAHEEKEKPNPEENAGIAAESGPAQERHLPPQNDEDSLSRKISRRPVSLNLDADYPVHLFDDYDSDNANDDDNADNEIQEVPRGRVGRRLEMSTSRLPSGSSLVSLGKGRMAEIPTRLSSTPPPPISPILSPISSSLNIPQLPHTPNSQPGSRSRPRTAPTTAVTAATTTISPSSPLASAPASRPGTADSTGPIRHHRLDSIRGATIPHRHVQGHRTPPTRDSSPSRSVRFVDYVDGESGHVGPSGPVVGGNGNDNEGRVVTVVEIPPPTPSRSSSFSKNRNGRTFLEGDSEEPSASSSSVSGSGSTTVPSRPPTL